ncbi:uncharacterized protein LOC130903851 [Diorhabda carinulata]|uniref:uncharacterized protein LOC130903851 n=1 Tax=Diorhabda carinulata TaxID=1163345 RepID=UPI0025A0D8CA|nr:uncharacterized protein LOC130903851 [Diorhabda carinulata]
MSTILMCRKIINWSIKTKFSSKNLKLHTFNGSKLPILKTNSHSNTSKRGFFKILRKPTKEDLKMLDDIPDHFKLIHRNTMERYILYTQIGTCLSIVIVVIFCMFSIKSSTKELKFLGQQKHVPRSTQNELEIYLAIFVALVVILQLIILKMPLRIYYCCKQKKYILIFPTNLPFTYSRMTCEVGDLEKLPLQGILPWKDARFRIKDRNIILIDDHFRRPADLSVMMGIQKDPDSED